MSTRILSAEMQRLLAVQFAEYLKRQDKILQAFCLKVAEDATPLLASEFLSHLEAYFSPQAVEARLNYVERQIIAVRHALSRHKGTPANLRTDEALTVSLERLKAASHVLSGQNPETVVAPMDLGDDIPF